jgi:hypothetical protein
MPVVGKVSKLYEYRCDDGNNTLKAQEMLAMGLVSVSKQHGGASNEDEQDDLSKLGAIAEQYVCLTNSVTHSSIISTAIRTEFAGREDWESKGIPRKYFETDPGLVNEFLTAKKYDWLQPTSDSDSYSLEVIPLPDLHEELTQKKIQTQYSFWTTPLNPDKPWTGDATLLFSPLEQGKYALQTDFVTISETNIKNLIVEEFVPLVGIRLYNHTYTVPTWVCNDVYESKVPTSNEENEKKYREKLIEDNKLLIQENNIDADNLSTEDLNKAIWNCTPSKNYSEIPSTPIGIASGDNNPFFQNNTYWTKKKLKEFGFLTESPGLTW